MSKIFRRRDQVEWNSRHLSRLDPNSGKLQLRVFRFGFLQDGNARVGVFPQREEIFVVGQRSGADGICATRIVPNFPICIALNQSNFEPPTTSVQFKNICI